MLSSFFSCCRCFGKESADSTRTPLRQSKTSQAHAGPSNSTSHTATAIKGTSRQRTQQSRGNATKVDPESLEDSHSTSQDLTNASSSAPAPVPRTRQPKQRTRAEVVESESLESSASSSADISSSAASSSAQASAASSEAAPLPCKGTNYMFYQNRVVSKPNPGGYIEHIHKNWFGSYNLLETHHGYIQWLFPVFESAGMSFSSVRLDKKEAHFMRTDLRSSVRLVKSYKLMLDFYGMELLNYETGEVGRRRSNYKDRYANLNSRGHNWLRFSRILMSLGELGFVRYKTPWMDFVEHELQSHSRLVNCQRSYKDFWRPLCDPTTKGYAAKTKETEEDRAESVFFEVMAAGGEEWEAIRQELDEYGRVADEPEEERPARAPKL